MYSIDDKVTIKFRKFRPEAKVPERKTDLAAGWDLFAAEGDLVLPGGYTIIPTGLNVDIPPGWELQIRSRSGLAAKKGIFVLNSPGAIDSDYSGNGPDFEIKVILHNTSNKAVSIIAGDRVAQAVLAPVYDLRWEEVSEIVSKDSNRVGGLGSTG